MSFASDDAEAAWAEALAEGRIDFDGNEREGPMTRTDATQGEEARADVAYLKHLAETERPYFGKDAQEALTRLLERVARAEEALTEAPPPLTPEMRDALNEGTADCDCSWDEDGFTQDDDCPLHAALEICDYWKDRSNA